VSPIPRLAIGVLLASLCLPGARLAAAEHAAPSTTRPTTTARLVLARYFYRVQAQAAARHGHPEQ